MLNEVPHLKVTFALRNINTPAGRIENASTQSIETFRIFETGFEKYWTSKYALLICIPCICQQKCISHADMHR